VRIHHLHRHGCRPVLRQQLDQAAVVQVPAHRSGESGSGPGPTARRRCSSALFTPTRPASARCGRSRLPPLPGRRLPVDGERYCTTWCCARSLGTAARPALHIGRAGAVDQGKRPKDAPPGCCHPVAHAQRAVDAFGHQVDRPVGGAQLDVQRRVPRQQRGQGRRDQAPADAAGHVHPQPPGPASPGGWKRASRSSMSPTRPRPSSRAWPSWVRSPCAWCGGTPARPAAPPAAGSPATRRSGQAQLVRRQGEAARGRHTQKGAQGVDRIHRSIGMND
jgi:hypothetical protein